jgi:hypothetical protein
MLLTLMKYRSVSGVTSSETLKIYFVICKKRKCLLTHLRKKNLHSALFNNIQENSFLFHEIIWDGVLFSRRLRPRPNNPVWRGWTTSKLTRRPPYPVRRRRTAIANFSSRLGGGWLCTWDFKHAFEFQPMIALDTVDRLYWSFLFQIYT